MTTVEQIEAALLAPFTEVAARISIDYPFTTVSIYSHSVGSLTSYQGHSLGIACTLKNAATEPYRIALSVDLAYLTTNPRVNASVSWEHPSHYIEAEFLPEWQSSCDWRTVSDGVLQELYADLPRLYDALLNALARGEPPE
jgi:hypothetical protein